MESDPQVSGWRPDFRPAEEQLDRQRGLLRALVGRRVVETWTVWFVGADWFADLPVVINFDGGSQLEICWQKSDDLSITWDTIDVGSTPLAWVDSPLEWRRNADVALASVVGGTVTGVRATHFLSETPGLWLSTDRGDLQVFNALDENGLTAQRPERDTTRDWRPVQADSSRPSARRLPNSDDSPPGRWLG